MLLKRKCERFSPKDVWIAYDAIKPLYPSALINYFLDVQVTSSIGTKTHPTKDDSFGNEH